MLGVCVITWSHSVSKWRGSDWRLCLASGFPLSCYILLLLPCPGGTASRIHGLTWILQILFIFCHVAAIHSQISQWHGTTNGVLFCRFALKGYILIEKWRRITTFCVCRKTGAKADIERPGNSKIDDNLYRNRIAEYNGHLINSEWVWINWNQEDSKCLLDAMWLRNPVTYSHLPPAPCKKKKKKKSNFAE